MANKSGWCGCTVKYEKSQFIFIFYSLFYVDTNFLFINLQTVLWI